MNPTPSSAPPVTRGVKDDFEQSLYAKRQKIFPRQVHGLFARLRVSGVLVLLGIFYITPFLRWDGHQAILLDLPARKFYIFGLTLWPQDFIYLAALLITAGLTLFFFTALFGRIWCGYACPQTVWTEAFLWMERKIEGDRAKQLKLDKAPWGMGKFRIKAAKHAAWIGFSAWTGFTFVGYFTPLEELTQRLFELQLGPWETFWIVFYGFATYGNAGWMREQVCIYMCPYARFQSAMFDKDTLIISYDKQRGEPKGSRKRGDDYRAQGLGDCVDCTLCVQVCPTGIDIRNGLQVECIACSACIDACDDVMDKVGYAKGLIRYTTENTMEGLQTRILRPRILVYGTILLALITALGYSISQRSPIGLDVIRDRNQLYRESAEGLIENVYTLKILNMDNHAHRYLLRAEGIPGLQLVRDTVDIVAESGQIIDLPVRLRADEADLSARSTHVQFIITATDTGNLQATEEARFLGPPP